MLNDNFTAVKKVCHVTSAHPRYDVRIFHKECKSLANNGFDVTLLVNDNLPDEYLDGINIISTQIKPSNRYERMIKSKKALRKLIDDINADLYHFHDPELLPEARWIKKKGKKVIFDFHEDVAEQIIDKQWIPQILRSFVSSIYIQYESRVITHFDGVISVTPHIVEKMRIRNLNTIMITNYPIIDLDENLNREPSNSICFAGGISEQWNHMKIIELLHSLDNIKYILAGSGKQSYLDRLKTLEGWSLVDYRGRISHDQVKEIYSKSIAGIALNYSNQAKGKGTLGNTKLFEYMAAKLPVICTDYELWKEVVEINHCGICVDVNNQVEIFDAIRFLANNPEEAKLMGENGRKAALNKYNWSIEERKLIDFYNNI